MNFKPVSNFIVVEPMVHSNTTKSGLVLPESAQDRPNQGKVIATGDGLRNDGGEIIPPLVKEGDHVIFQKFSGIEIKLEGVKYILMRDTDIFGIVTNG